jgi:DNA-binding protein Fis
MWQNTQYMHNLKRVGISVAVIALGVSIFAGVSLWSLQQYFGTSAHIKQWLVESQVYPAIQTEIITQSVNNTAGQGEGITLSEPLVKQALERSITEAYVRESAEQVIDGTYAWLDGTTATPVYEIDVTPVKTAFADSIITSANTRLKDLPDCILPDQATTTDPFKVNCNPPASIRTSELDRLRKEIATNPDFLPQNITAETYNLDQSAQSTAVNVGTPWYENVSYLPTLFQWTVRGPVIFLMFGVLSAASIVLLSTSRRAGVRRTATTVLSSSLALALSSVALLFTVRYIKGPSQGQSSALMDPILEVFRLASTALGQWQLITCLVLALISGGILIGLRFTHKDSQTAK